MEFRLKDFSIGAFNRGVNQSGDLPRKYEAWGGYRRWVSALVGEAFLRDPRPGSALVLGAGNLNDLDLRFLCARLDRLVLSDADLEGMERGIARQALSGAERGKIEWIQADYIGANDAGLFPELERMAKRAAPAAEIADDIKAVFTELAKRRNAVFAQTFPLVISCPIYTQLLYTQVEVFLKILFEAGLYPYDDLNLILNAAYGAMPGILARYNDVLLSACGAGGRIALLADIVEMPRGSAVYRQAKRAEKDGTLAKADAESLVKKHGLELSQAGLEDFESKAEIIREAYAVWPFDETKEYLVCGCLAGKRG